MLLFGTILVQERGERIPNLNRSAIKFNSGASLKLNRDQQRGGILLNARKYQCSPLR